MFSAQSADPRMPTAGPLRVRLVEAATAMLAHPQQIVVPSLRSIARACSVAPSAVYWHFPSEAHLRSAVLDVQYADLVTAVERGAAAAGDDPRHALIGAGLAYVDWGLSNPGAYQLLHESPDALGPDRAQNGLSVQNRIVALAAAIDPQAPFASALLLWSALHGLVSLRVHKPEAGWETSATQDAVQLIATLTDHATATTSTTAKD